MKVGQKVYLDGKEIIEREITKVGRKYFYISLSNSRFNLETMKEVTDMGSKRQVYLSRQELEDKKERRLIISYVQNKFKYAYENELSLDQLKVFYQIMKAEKVRPQRMGMVSKDFGRHEYACKDGCGFDTVDVELAFVVQDVRDHFDEKTHINSGCRCPIHNRDEGGEDDSWHLIGKAADIRVDNVHADRVADYLDAKYPDKYGVGRYRGRTHIDVRKERGRWDRRALG